MRIYFAGPLFCNAERAFNLRLAEKLEAKGYQVFLPQGYGVESESLHTMKWPMMSCSRLYLS
jgi:nucleoside 2-deoxyribosyltransferase